MIAHYACRLVLATFAVGWALPATAQEIADPATRQRVRDRVELYYQTRPLLRPTSAWLASRPAPTCSTPRYPRAGLLDELEGTTILSFQINTDGKASNARLTRSAGAAVLDEAALEALAVCTFKPDAAAERQDISYRFYLD